MKERPILFQGAMVCALLAGTKTQTRRIVKDPPRHWSERMFMADGGGVRWEPSGYTQVRPGQNGLFIWGVYPIGSTEPARESPYGSAGDRLWVRETWGFDSGVRGDFRPLGRNDLSGMDLLDHTLYRADGGEAPRWRPSIHMPRWASRITLEVTSVRAERLQSISEEDAKAEGVTLLAEDDCWSGSYRSAFEYLWGEINGWASEPKARAPWATNPWLWVVTFKRVAP